MRTPLLRALRTANAVLPNDRLVRLGRERAVYTFEIIVGMLCVNR